MRHATRASFTAVWLLGACAGATAQQPPLFTAPVERCIVPAAAYHSVDPYVLRAILKIESGLRPSVVSGNDNGTVDRGLGGMNSMHDKRLAQHGVHPGHLMDPCIATYVAAWHLRNVMNESGNTWEGIARYHSATPYFNHRYRIMLNNELVRMRVIEGRILPVPPLRPSQRKPDQRPSSDRSATSGPPSVVVDGASP